MDGRQFCTATGEISQVLPDKTGAKRSKAGAQPQKGLDYTLMSLNLIRCATGATKDVRKRSDVG